MNIQDLQNYIDKDFFIIRDKRIFAIKVVSYTCESSSIDGETPHIALNANSINYPYYCFTVTPFDLYPDRESCEAALAESLKVCSYGDQVEASYNIDSAIKALSSYTDPTCESIVKQLSDILDQVDNLKTSDKRL